MHNRSCEISQYSTLSTPLPAKTCDTEVSVNQNDVLLMLTVTFPCCTAFALACDLPHNFAGKGVLIVLVRVRAKDIDRQRRAPGSSSAAARVRSEHRQFHYLQSRRFPFARTSGHVTLSLRMRETAMW